MQWAVAQASRFGAEMLLAREVMSLDGRGPVRVVCLGSAGEVEARAVLVATGVSYRRLEASGLADLTGRGVYYGASASEAAQCADQVVHVVGAANSAGQAVLNFAKVASKVVLLVRGAGLEDSMSEYLVERIKAADNVEVRFRTEVVAAHGTDHLESVTLADRDSGAESDEATNWLFVFIGAAPRTDWLDGTVVRDDKGFILAGPELLVNGERRPDWPLDRDPYLLETSIPGVFVAGDVRSESVKRVASAVGEGALAVMLVHRYLEKR